MQTWYTGWKCIARIRYIKQNCKMEFSGGTRHFLSHPQPLLIFNLPHASLTSSTAGALDHATRALGPIACRQRPPPTQPPASACPRRRPPAIQPCHAARPCSWPRRPNSSKQTDTGAARPLARLALPDRAVRLRLPGTTTATPLARSSAVDGMHCLVTNFWHKSFARQRLTKDWHQFDKTRSDMAEFGRISMTPMPVRWYLEGCVSRSVDRVAGALKIFFEPELMGVASADAGWPAKHLQVWPLLCVLSPFFPLQTTKLRNLWAWPVGDVTPVILKYPYS
jgi:hypothetical protein